MSELVLDEAKGERPDPEVAAVAKRRRFTAEYKLRILREAEALKNRGEEMGSPA